MSNLDPTGADRLSQNVRPEGECLRWTGAHTPTGYGQMRIGGIVMGVHRVAYKLSRGLIPEGMEVDHLCRVRDCVNPDHLEAVTHRENLRRSMNPHLRFDVTECIEGHPLSGDNLYRYPDGRRQCRTCRVVNQSNWKRAADYGSSTACECGLDTTPSNLARHRRSKRHSEAMTARRQDHADA